MFTKFWNRITGKVDAKLQLMIQTTEQLKKENIELNGQVNLLREQVESRNKKLSSNEPYIELVSDGFDVEKGIKIDLDWNSALIEHLKENGLQGTNDYEVVRKYLAHMYLNIIEEMGEGTL